jgi:hypothetical protein
VQNRSERIDRVQISDTAEQYSVLLSADDHPVVLVRMMADAVATERWIARHAAFSPCGERVPV